MEQKGPDLGESIRGKIAERGYEAQDSFGFCSNFPGSSIYFGWRKS